MTSLQAIGITLAAGSVVTTLSLGLFGYAVSKRSIFIAPRATARPRNVIYHPNPKHPSQNRGSPIWGWIPWSLKLTYDQMLKGVPGTGTREGGLKGSMLKLNLDGIILLRFHAFCRRVTIVATFLFVVILLPVYFSSTCYQESQNGVHNSTFCGSANITSYVATTIANVPQVTGESDPSVEGRLYTASFVFWVLVAYILYLLDQEWVRVLAIRRVYYLEYDVWGERRKELKETMLYSERMKKKLEKHKAFTFQEEEERVKKPDSIRDRQVSAGSEEHLVNRAPWIPHPEQRDTVPNVALYSILVGGLPSLPERPVSDIEMGGVITKRDSIDWQLSLTTAFFDHCVPNQPGFSSSVAAVTIIPSAGEMTEAWRKWYTAASKLRRLRFIRKEIASRRHYSIEIDADDDEVMVMMSPDGNIPEIPELVSPADTLPEETPRPIYGGLEKQKSYFKQVFGSVVDEETDQQINEAISFGPEQAAVYSREFAQAAAPCCPNGCREDRIRRARIDELVQMEREAAAEVHKANLALNEIRRKVAVSAPPAGQISDGVEQIPSSDRSLSDNSTKRNRITTVESLDMPSDLGLEAKIYKKASSKSTPALKRANSNLSAMKDKTVSAPRMSSHDSDEANPRPCSEEWLQVESIIEEVTTSERHTMNNSMNHRSVRARPRAESYISSGSWQAPNPKYLVKYIGNILQSIRSWAQEQSAEAVSTLARSSTYAVVTFTSRQAAVAARNCLADGRGTGRWFVVKGLPIPPLADAAAGDLTAFRNCCRPVTVSINERQKNTRLYITYIVLILFYVFYTVPLTLAQSLVSAQSLNTLFPRLTLWTSKAGVNLSGIISSMVLAFFFASLPSFFKTLANFGSGAESVARAEFKALQYYWWFMVITAFSGSLLVTMALNAIDNNLEFGPEFRNILRSIAETIPTSTSALWLNWIILRFTVTLPLNYLLQINTYIFHWMGCPCCSRMTIGGGPGGPTPYRIYVDSGVVLMCVLALGPQSPLVSVFALAYFLVMEPLMRRNLIFMYRPKFDAGGLRWVFIFDMIISACILGIVLLTTQMLLKASIGPAVVAALPVIPIILYSRHAKTKYLPAFRDAALLQTSLLDGWDTSEGSSVEQREEFRQFLVDAHKAAYVPVCIAGSDTTCLLTAEPAVAVPLETELLPMSPASEQSLPEEVVATEAALLPERKHQHGATLRRAVGTLTLLRRKNGSHDLMKTLNESFGSGIFDSTDELPQGDRKAD